MAWFSKQSDEDRAVSILQDDCNEYGGPTPIVRHYTVSEASDDFERRAGIRLTDAQSARVVQRVRDRYGMGPIKDYNMPGYVDPDDDAEDQDDQRSWNAYRDARDTDVEREQAHGFWGRLFGR